MKTLRSKTFILSLALLSLSPLAQATLIYSLAADAEVRNDGTIVTTADEAWVGRRTQQRNYVTVFDLSSVPDNQVFTSANFRVRVSRNDSPTNNVDVYGLGYRTNSTVLVSDYYLGALDGSATLIQDNFVTLASLPTTSAVTFNTDGTGDTNLVNYLNAQYTASAADRALSNPVYVFIRMNTDSTGTDFKHYKFQTQDQSASFNRPYLEYETALAVPEASTLAAALFGGALLLASRRLKVSQW